MPLKDKFDTKIIVTEMKEITSGTNSNQQPFTLYQVQAMKAADHQPIAIALRSFENLPLNEELEVECKLFPANGNYPDSYTIKRKGQRRGNSLAPRVAHLEGQMKAVMERLGMTHTPPPGPQAAAPAAPAPAPAAPPAPPPPPQRPAPPAAPEASGGPAPVPQPQQVQPPPPQPPPGGYGPENQFGGDDDIPF